MSLALSIDYAEACHPDKWKVLGKRLRDFALGHLLCLHRIQSPYVTGESEATIADLLTGIELCRGNYKEAVNKLQFGNSFGLRMRARFWAVVAKSNPELVNRHGLAFQEYIKAACKGPRGVFKKEGGETTSAPFVLLHCKDLIGSFGYTFETLMDAPLRRVIYERHALLEADGAISWPWHLQSRKVEEAARG